MERVGRRGWWGRSLALVGGDRVARCWALRNQAVLSDDRVTLVFLWLFGCWIVDASIFVAVLLRMPLLSPFGEWGWGVLFLLCLCVWRQAMKGVWWMPWHQEPMKDVGACDKPRGAGNRAVIRGFPNGETQPSRTRLPAPEHIGQAEVTWGSETSQYPQEEKATAIP